MTPSERWQTMPSMEITPKLLQAIVPSLNLETRASEAVLHAEALDRALRQGGIQDPAEVAMFLAQVAHETGAFRYMEEIASGNAYEGRVDLGNREKGDGARYKGRGYFQLTGRANYRWLGTKLGYNFEEEPDLAKQPFAAAEVAVAYWEGHKIGPLARARDLEGVTRKINGGLNGLESRRAFYLKALKAVGL